MLWKKEKKEGSELGHFVIKNWFNLKNVIKEILIDNHL